MQEVLPLVRFIADYYAVIAIVVVVLMVLKKASQLTVFMMAAIIIITGLAGGWALKDLEFAYIKDGAKIIDKQPAGPVVSADFENRERIGKMHMSTVTI